MITGIATTIVLVSVAVSALCAWLLLRGWRASGSRLLFWSALCFVGLFANSLLVVVDLLFLPSVNLVPLRQLANLGAAAVLLYGFIWDSN